MKNYKNKKAFALIIAIWVTLVMWFLAFFIFEYMVPFSKNTKGIENAGRAYYQAESAVEDALYFSNKTRADYSTESWTTLTDWALWNSFSMEAAWSFLPPAWKWNSEFSSDWNTIMLWSPIQLDIWRNIVSSWGNFRLYVRVPDLNLDWENNETLKWSDTPIINWQLSSLQDSLNARSSWLTEDDIRDWQDFVFNWKEWRNLSGTDINFEDFYEEECIENDDICSLKLSVVNRLLLEDDTPVPYLEWKIDAWTNIPLRYTNIESVWKSYGFKKDLEVRVPQQSVNEGFDFTIFQ